MAFDQYKLIHYELINKYVIGKAGRYHSDMQTSGNTYNPNNYYSGYMPIILWAGHVYATNSSATNWYAEGTRGPGIASVSVTYSSNELTLTLNKEADVSTVNCCYTLVNDRCYWTSNSGNQRGVGYNTWKTYSSIGSVKITYICQQDGDNDACQYGNFNNEFFYYNSTAKGKVYGYGGINVIIYGYISYIFNSINNASSTTASLGSNGILSETDHLLYDKMVPPIENLQYAYQPTINYPYCLAILKISRSGVISSAVYSKSNGGSVISATCTVPNSRYCQIGLSVTGSGTLHISGAVACGNDSAGYTSGIGRSGGMNQFTCVVTNTSGVICVSTLQQVNDNNDSWDCTTEFGNSGRRFNYFWVYVFGYVSKNFSFSSSPSYRLTYMNPTDSELMYILPRSGELYINKTSQELMTRIPVVLFWGNIVFNSGTPTYTLYTNSKITLSAVHTSTTISITMYNNDNGNLVYGYAFALNNSYSTARSYGFPLFYCSSSNNAIVIQGFRQAVGENDSWSQITWAEHQYDFNIICLGYTNTAPSQSQIVYYTYSNPYSTTNISATANGTVSVPCSYNKYTYTNGSLTNTQTINVNINFNVTPNVQSTTRQFTTEYSPAEGVTVIATATQNASTQSVSLTISGEWTTTYDATISGNNMPINCYWTITRTYNGSTTQLYHTGTNNNDEPSDYIDVTALSVYNTSTFETAGAIYTITADVDTNDYSYSLYNWTSTSASITRSLISYSIQGNFCSGYELVGTDNTKPTVTWTIKRGSTTVGTKTTSKVVPPTFIESNYALTTGNYEFCNYDGTNNVTVGNATTGYVGSDWEDLYLKKPFISTADLSSATVLFYCSSNSGATSLLSQNASIVGYNEDFDMSTDNYYDYNDYINIGTNFSNNNNIFYFGVNVIGDGSWSFNFYSQYDLYGIMIDSSDAVYTISCVYNGQTYSTTYTIPSGITNTLYIKKSTSITVSLSSTTIQNNSYVNLNITPSIFGNITVSITSAMYNYGLRLNSLSNTSTSYTINGVSTDGTTVKLYNASTATTDRTVSASAITTRLTPWDTNMYNTSSKLLSGNITLKAAASSNITLSVTMQIDSTLLDEIDSYMESDALIPKIILYNNNSVIATISPTHANVYDDNVYTTSISIPAKLKNLKIRYLDQYDVEAPFTPTCCGGGNSFVQNAGFCNDIFVGITASLYQGSNSNADNIDFSVSKDGFEDFSDYRNSCNTSYDLDNSAIIDYYANYATEQTFTSARIEVQITPQW